MNKAMGLPVDSSVDLDYAPVAAGSHGLSMDKEAQRSPKRRRKSSDTVSDEQDIRPSTSVQDAPHLVGLEGRGKQQSMNGNVASVVSGELSSRGNEGPVDREDCDADHMKEERHAGGEHGQEKNAQEVEGEARDEKRSGVGEKEDSAQEEIIADEDIGGNEEDQEEEEVDEEGDGGGGVDKTSSVDGAEVDIARARSAWMIFLSHNREKVRKENPGLAVGPMQKILSAMWKGLDEKESARYAKLAADDKARMKKELADAGLTSLPVKKSTPVSIGGSSPTDLILPLARVRKTIRLDPTVGNITKEGLQLVAKATEVFMEVMADRAWRVGRQTGRKSVKPCDLADYIFASPELYWLRDEFRLERSSVKKSANKLETSGKASVGKKPTPPVATGAKAITSFFKKA